MSPFAQLTSLGLPDIELVPYGLHACHFYESAADLEGLLVPYFAAGLRNRERCLWVTSETMNAARAKAALQALGFDVAAEERDGALVIKDYADFYPAGGVFNGAEILAQWLAEEQRALADGFNGLRISGNIVSLPDEFWPVFMDYEKAADEAFYGRRIVALCTYQRVGPSSVLDVVRRHDCALERRGEGWQASSSGPGALSL